MAVNFIITNSNGCVMTYGKFCGAKLGGRRVVSPREFGNIRVATRRFMNPTISHRNVGNFHLDLRITFSRVCKMGAKNWK